MTTKTKNVLVIGGGPSGMMAAIIVARAGHRVTIIERNEKLGKKLYITGKGRCNLTNATDVEDLLANTVSNPKFMYSSYYTFDSYGTMAFFEELGLHLKTERGNRVFPASDKSSDVLKVLKNEIERLNIQVMLQTKVNQLLVENQVVIGVKIDKGTLHADEVIVATGGLSYDMTGSTGDGYKFAKACGHQIIETVPSLVPLEVLENDYVELQGISLKNVKLTLLEGTKVLYEVFGEMMFTHFGVTGPLVLSASSYLPKKLSKNVQLCIDLKPALTDQQLDDRILKDFSKGLRKSFKNALDELLPKKMIPVIIQRVGIDPEKKVDQITKEERLKLVHILKTYTLTVTKRRPYNEAVITSGGVHVKEINPNTMSSKKVSHLYFVGEVLDIDALTGGFNLQIAFSTAYLAGMAINEARES